MEGQGESRVEWCGGARSLLASCLKGLVAACRERKMSVITLNFLPICIFGNRNFVSLRSKPCCPPLRRCMVPKASLAAAHFGLAVEDDFHAFLEVTHLPLPSSLNEFVDALFFLLLHTSHINFESWAYICVFP